ncbi:MAG: DUF2062 domain-containing protein [Pseudomonadota bacterium]
MAVWPRRSWWRSIRYLLLRVLRLTASPHVIAMGVAAGVFASFTPFLGFHFVTAWTICFFTRGSYFAAATGTFFGNPLTFPFIWASTLAAGRFILSGLGVDRADQFEAPDLSFSLIVNSFDTVWPMIKAMTLGSLPIGIPVAFVCYLVVRQMARIYQKSRLKMLADKARSDWANRLDRQLQAEYEANLEVGETSGPADEKPSDKAML